MLQRGRNETYRTRKEGKQTSKQRVTGSSPVGGTNFLNKSALSPEADTLSEVHTQHGPQQRVINPGSD